MPVLADLVCQHPALKLDVRLQDSFADPVREGLDLVVRVGPLRDSTLVARRIDWQQLVVVASPDYLRKHGTPTRIEDLARHSIIVFRQPASGRNRPWQLRQGRRQVEFQPEPRAQVNEGEGMMALAAMGLGLAQVPDYMAGEELARGLVVEVMPSHRPGPLPISAVTPSSRLMPPRVRLVLDALETLRKRRA